jgi:hypothetical protein
MVDSNGNISGVPSIDDIQQSLGLGEGGDFGRLMCRAAVGGRQFAADQTSPKINLAFNVQPGVDSADGYLIAGAKPFWNIFSNESPGMWVLVNGKINFVLKDYYPYGGGYRMGIDHFDGYKKHAAKPSINSFQIHSNPENNTSTMAGNVDLGDYDWSKMLKRNFPLDKFSVGINCGVYGKIVSDTKVSENSNWYAIFGDFNQSIDAPSVEGRLFFRRLSEQPEDYYIQSTPDFQTVFDITVRIAASEFKKIPFYGFSADTSAAAEQIAEASNWTVLGDIYRRKSTGIFYQGDSVNTGFPRAGFYCIAPECWVKLDDSGNLLDFVGLV